MAGPRDAEVTIVGGGALGAAVAYFLARDGRTDVQLLEARGLCEATSSQAAGFVGQARPTVERARLTMAAAEVFRNFERDAGYSMDYRECGAVRLAMALVESLGGDPSPYVRSLSPDRFIPRTWSFRDARVQAQAVYENYYPMPVAP